MLSEALKGCIIVAAIGSILIGAGVFAYSSYKELKPVMKSHRALVIITVLAVILGAILGIPVMVLAMFAAADNSSGTKLIFFTRMFKCILVVFYVNRCTTCLFNTHSSTLFLSQGEKFNEKRK